MKAQRTKSNPSVMRHRFSEVPSVKIPRSSFDRSHGLKTTFDAGLLIPIYVDEALPGDTFNLNMTAITRMATPLKPVMDNMRLETFFFAVPIRLIWDNWEKFNGAQDDPGDSTDFLVPQFENKGVAPVVDSTLDDYLCLPIGSKPGGYDANSLWHRSYNLIWNEWFRDENLQNSVVVDRDDGPDTAADYTLLRRGKRHDYFTSALPWPQKGDAVTIPLGTSAPVYGIGKANQTWSTGINAYETDGTGTRAYATANTIQSSAGINTTWYAEEDPNNSGYPNIRADLTNAVAASINQLRQGFQTQKLLERDARGGTRYIEIVRSHFGVTSPDARHQRPEYLGGGSTTISVSPVAQTAPVYAGTEFGDPTPMGHLSGVGLGVTNGHGFVKSFTEHCILLGLASVRADLTYQQGLPRMYSRRTRYDFYWPTLAHIGEQAILNKEIYTAGATEGQDDDVFGYQERYAEYRYKPSMVTGKFRSDANGSLDVWHLSQDFAARPNLNASFIEDVPPLDRVIAVPSEPHFICDAYFSLRCARPMPLYGVPGLIDHF